MSLWFPLMVNDEQIGRVEITRTFTHDDGNHTYMWTMHADNEPHGLKLSSIVQHQESDGAWELVRKVLNDSAGMATLANITVAGYGAMQSRQVSHAPLPGGPRTSSWR